MTAPVVATISDVTITGGNAVFGGGVEVNSASGNPALHMTGDAVMNNSATREGGGIDFQSASQGGTLTLSDSLVANNQLLDTGDPNVTGGGIVLSGGGTLTNVTVTGNSVNPTDTVGGGGTENLGTAPVTIASSTIEGNSTADSNVPGSGGNLSGNSFRLLDSIVAGGSGPAGRQNCGAPEISLGHNLEDLNQCGLTGPGDQVNKNPMLGTLAPIPNAASTLALMPGSPGDQRRRRRLHDGNLHAAHARPARSRAPAGVSVRYRRVRVRDA